MESAETNYDNLVDLAAEYNFEYACENGQHTFGPPKDWEGPIPPCGSEVHVGHLARNLDELTLLPFFMTAGRIYVFRLLRTFSGDNRGYCFVKYATKEDAANAIATLNGKEFNGKNIKVQLSIENRKLFIVPIPVGVTSTEACTELKNHFQGIIGIIIKRRLRKRRNSEREYCYAIVEFADHRHAALARKSILENEHRIWDEPLDVDWSVPNLSHTNESRTVVILDVSPLTPLQSLKRICNANTYGNKGVVAIRGYSTHVHVRFDCYDNALRVIRNLDGTIIDGQCVTVDWKKNFRHLLYEGRNHPSAAHRRAQAARYTDVPVVQLVPHTAEALYAFAHQGTLQQAGPRPSVVALYASPSSTQYQNPGIGSWSYFQQQPQYPTMRHSELGWGADAQAIQAPLQVTGGSSIVSHPLTPVRQGHNVFQYPAVQDPQPSYPNYYSVNQYPDHASPQQTSSTVGATLNPVLPGPTATAGAPQFQQIGAALGTCPQYPWLRQF